MDTSRPLDEGLRSTCPCGRGGCDGTGGAVVRAAGLAALALPVWLHLLKKHRSTPLPFASLMFFERRTQSSVKHRRLRYLRVALRTALWRSWRWRLRGRT